MEVLFFSLLPLCEPLFEQSVSVEVQFLSMVVERPSNVTARFVVFPDLLSLLEAVSASSFLPRGSQGFISIQELNPTSTTFNHEVEVQIYSTVFVFLFSLPSNVTRFFMGFQWSRLTHAYEWRNTQSSIV